MNADVARKIGKGATPTQAFLLASGATQAERDFYDLDNVDTYTESDLLKWLAVDHYFLAQVYYLPSPGVWGIVFENTDSGLDGEAFNHTSLLGCLEQAVLAVPE